MKRNFEELILLIIGWSFFALIGFWKELLDAFEPLYKEQGIQFFINVLRIILPSPKVWIIEIIIIILIFIYIWLKKR